MKQQKKLWGELEEDIERRMANRTKVLNPFRLDAFKHIYEVALDAEEWKAFNFLNSREVFRSVFSTTHEATTRFTTNELKVRFEVIFSDNWDDDRYPYVETDWERIHPKAREYIMKWVLRDEELSEDERYVRRHLREVEDHCNTWGQAARIWPQLVAFYPSKMRKKFLNRKADSSLPEYSWETNGDGVVELIPMCRPSYYERATELIAEASLLPKYSRAQFGTRPRTVVSPNR